MNLSSIFFGSPPDEEKPKEAADDPYSGFGIEEVAAPLQTDDLEYDEGFQVLHLRSTKALHIHVSISYFPLLSFDQIFKKPLITDGSQEQSRTKTPGNFEWAATIRRYRSRTRPRANDRTHRWSTWHSH